MVHRRTLHQSTFTPIIRIPPHTLRLRAQPSLIPRAVIERAFGVVVTEAAHPQAGVVTGGLGRSKIRTGVLPSQPPRSGPKTFHPTMPADIRVL